MLLLAALLLTSAAADAGTWRKPDGDPGYEGYRTLAQELVDESDSRARAHHLCFVVERITPAAGTPEEQRRSRSEHGWLYWREGRWLFDVGPTGFPPLSGTAIFGGGSIDLAHDVIRSERDRVGAFDRRTTRTFVQRITAACRVHGTSFVVRRQAAGRKG